ncbi:hypothetical protein [Akkermansia sp.]|uniref:hypothetical protein n=2 Tax=Akkermansia sp. TaxID=1872421 RepID=UPI002672BD51|nr:hypothetical protein [Akkermansia sp.]MEE0763874.1 hypothetical protein [Akkermansia sp.]
MVNERLHLDAQQNTRGGQNGDARVKCLVHQFRHCRPSGGRDEYHCREAVMDGFVRKRTFYQVADAAGSPPRRSELPLLRKSERDNENILIRLFGELLSFKGIAVVGHLLLHALESMAIFLSISAYLSPTIPANS